jgi:hypothetical protein
VQLHIVRDWLGHTSIEQMSTSLKNTVRSKHDAMEGYERRIGRQVQPSATDSGTGGAKGTPPAANTSRNTQENPNGRDPATVN